AELVARGEDKGRRGLCGWGVAKPTAIRADIPLPCRARQYEASVGHIARGVSDRRASCRSRCSPGRYRPVNADGGGAQRAVSPHAHGAGRAPVPAAPAAVAPAGADPVLARPLEQLRRDVHRTARPQLLPPVVLQLIPAALADPADSPLQRRRLVLGGG